MRRSKHIMSIAAIVILAIVLIIFATTSSADPAAKYEAECADCHYMEDFDGLTEADLLAYMRAVNAGEASHPPLGLTEDEVATMAEYLAQE